MSDSSHSSAIRLKGELSNPPGRGLWIIKIILIIPHLVILSFLSIAVLFINIIAFFAVIFTGKYPRNMFDFVVGVLRWYWRVGFYSFCALGTDLYPPFSLKSIEDYPADLEIDYPENLSQWKPLVKWILAAPHYLILAVLTSGINDGSLNSLESMHQNWKEDIYSYGLLSLLIMIAAIYLLFTGRYFKDIFPLIMGINRWVLRVCAYVGLLTDEYPHFRLMDRE